MSEVAAKPKGGRRARVSVAERVAFTRSLVESSRGDRAKVHAGFVEFYGETPARTIDEYIRRVHDAWLHDARENAPSERERFLASLGADLALYARAKAWGPHQSARRLQARVLGLDVQQVDVRGGLTLTAVRAQTEDDLSAYEVELAAEILDVERARLAASTAEQEPAKGSAAEVERA